VANGPAQTDISSSGPGYGGGGGTTPYDPKSAPPPLPPPPSGVGLMTVQSPDQLMGAATSQVDAELKGSIDPLQSQYNLLGNQEDRAARNIQAMFGNLMPYVAGAAQNVQGAYGQAEAAQADILAAAQTKLSQLKQSRAQEAQALAQEMGGPVSMGEFTAGLDDQASLLASLSAGEQMHTNQYGLADVSEANAFAGRVFPLVQTEQTAKARQFFEDQKKTIQDQISSLKGQRGSKINSAYNDLLTKEREFALQKTQEALDKTKAQHDWLATQRTLKNDDARLKLAQDQAKLDKAGVTGTLDGKPTLAARQLTAQEKDQAAQLGLSNKEYLLRKQQLTASTKHDSQVLAATNRATWAAYLDAAVNPQPGKTVQSTQWVPYQQGTRNSPPIAAMKHPDQFQFVNGTWYHSVTTVNTPVNRAITNPTALVDYLVGHNVPKKIAINMVKARLQLPDWVYGEADPNAPVGTGGRSGKDITRPG
jgi:hypothetical protein